MDLSSLLYFFGMCLFAPLVLAFFVGIFTIFGAGILYAYTIFDPSVEFSWFYSGCIGTGLLFLVMLLKEMKR